MQRSSWGRPLEPLVSRFGVVNATSTLPAARGLPDLVMVGAMIGSGQPGRWAGGDQTAAGGRALGDAGLARALALAEAAERYSSWEPPNVVYRRCSAADLDGRALDHTGFPRCSPAEYAAPDCPVVPFDEDAEIRWVPGTDLQTGEEVWVPARMATYRLAETSAAERFWYPISTGFAVHSDPVAAVFGGLAEVVERDAIALLWLQRLPLPEIPRSAVDGDPQAAVLLDWCAGHHVEARLFDATTDLGLPTVYAVLRSPHDEVLHTLVGAGTGMTITEATLKALLESVAVRLTVSTSVAPPETFADFHAVIDGARYTGAYRHAAAFDFLLAPHPDRPPYRERGRYADDSGTALRRLAGTLADAGLEAAVVDRTSDELAEVGLTAVCVVVPGVQPMSLDPRAQFRAHPRLYTGPVRMGYPAADLDDLNPLPQPFG